MFKYLAGIVIIFVLAFCMVSCEKVPAGNVGVKFNLYGGDKGVQTTELPPGRYMIVPWNQEITTFPTFTQTRVWCTPEPGSSDPDESIKFGTSEGMNVGACVGITYRVDPSKVTTLFQTYRKGIVEITDTILHNVVNNAMVRQASTMKIESVYGVEKAAMIDSVQKDVAAQMAPQGIIVEKLYWVGTLGLPEQVVTSINNKIKATQMADQRNNEVAQSKAEALKNEAEATGKANAALTIATAEATAIKLRGDALKDNPGIARLNCIEKWDGHVPTQTVGSVGICDFGNESRGNIPAAIVNLK